MPAKQQCRVPSPDETHRLEAGNAELRRYLDASKERDALLDQVVARLTVLSKELASDGSWFVKPEAMKTLVALHGGDEIETALRIIYASNKVFPTGKEFFKYLHGILNARRRECQ